MDSVTLILFVAGLGLLLIGAEALVRGASRLATSVGISPLVAGLTIVAFGTSSPELAIGVQSALTGQAALALGNIIGSNIANVLLILGISASITSLIVAQQLVRLEVPLMVALSFLMLLLALDGTLSRIEGLLLLAIGIAFTIFVVRRSRNESREIEEEYAQEFGGEPAQGGWQLLLQFGLVVGGLALLVLGSNWLVDGAIAVAQVIGVSELVIGLTVIAIGTSLPEIATSGVASLRGERDIAVGGVVGSNIYNIVLVLGSVIAVAPTGVEVPPAAVNFDIPVMIVVAVSTLPIFFTGYVIARWEGILFLGYYIAYTLYLILEATEHDRLPAFSNVMLLFVLPLTAVTLLVLVSRQVRYNTRSARSDLESD
ncbi:MAG: calcium/sodium antiporter [Chloroflexota bacterium]|nr:calcium/sodium antiporter [Chloroflexota bacterium]